MLLHYYIETMTRVFGNNLSEPILNNVVRETSFPFIYFFYTCGIMISKTSKFSVISGPSVAMVTPGAVSVVKKERKPSELGPDFETCQVRFDRVYENISNETACKASLQDRNDMKVNKDFTLTYGELDTMEPIWKLLDKVNTDFADQVEIHSSARKQKFYDLGSGSGCPVVAAALSLQQQIMNRKDGSLPHTCVGVELLPGLFELSIQAQKEYQTVMTKDCADLVVCPMEFYLGSIFDLSVCDWTDGDIVFVNSTCFDVSMLLKVYNIAEKLRVGAVMITLSRSLIEIGALNSNIKTGCACSDETPPMWRLLFESREVMSW